MSSSNGGGRRPRAWRSANCCSQGKVYEWRGRQHSLTRGIFVREAWYTLRPSELLTLDTLPTRAVRYGSTFKRQFISYKEQLEEANRAHPENELVWTDVQRQWLEHLDALGLDAGFPCPLGRATPADGRDTARRRGRPPPASLLESP